MYKVNANSTPPTLGILDACGTTGCYVRIANVYRSQIQCMCDRPIVTCHQFVFDERLQVGIMEIRDAGTGELRGLVQNLAIPYGLTCMEEVNA